MSNTEASNEKKSAAPKEADKSRSAEKTDRDYASYNDVVKAAELSTVMLISSEFNVQSDFFTYSDNLELRSGAEREDVLVDDEEGFATQVIKFRVSADVDDEVYLEAKATYLVAFTLNERVSEDAVKDFVDRVAVFTAYPYFRARVSQYSWEANAELPPMPMIKAPPRKSAKQAKKTT